jgi:hypothetical protein
MGSEAYLQELAVNLSGVEQIRLKARLSDGRVQELLMEISVDVQSRLWQIQVENAGEDVTCFRETDIFKAMQTLREYLEAKGCQLLCAGARPDVWPSGMSRDMGGGRIAYVIQLGKQATEWIDIFDYAEPAVVGTVQQQREFVEAWYASQPGLRLRRESKFWISTWLKNLFAKSR